MTKPVRQRLLALSTYPSSWASTRLRIDALAPYLLERGIELLTRPLLSEDGFAGFYAKGRGTEKAKIIATSTLAQLPTFLSAARFDAVLVQREAHLVGPPVLEWFYHRVAGKPLIFDFDDAVWLRARDQIRESRHPVAAAVLKSPSKSRWLLRRASLAIAGSETLAKEARRHNRNVLVAPTVVSRDAWRPPEFRSRGELHGYPKPVIGWVGSRTTASNLALVAPALRRLRAEGASFELRVVGASEDFSLEGLDIENVRWSFEREIELVRDLDIGLAPLAPSPFAEGKCGFKEIEYMAAGVPFVSSSVGGGRDFLRHDVNCLVARDEGDWYQHLGRLLGEPELRARLVSRARDCIESRLCIQETGPRIARAICEVMP